MIRPVRFTATAQEHVRREKAWWRANRDYPDVFAEELKRALEVVSRLPGAGWRYVQSPIPGVRRVYLRRTNLHVYYTFDDHQILIRAVWGSSTRARPRHQLRSSLRAAGCLEQIERVLTVIESGGARGAPTFDDCADEREHPVPFRGSGRTTTGPREMVMSSALDTFRVQQEAADAVYARLQARKPGFTPDHDRPS